MKKNLQKRTASVDSLRNGAIGKRRRPRRSTTTTGQRKRTARQAPGVASPDELARAEARAFVASLPAIPSHTVAPSAPVVDATPVVDEVAEKWRRAGRKILEEVERGEAQRLETENEEDFARTLTTAADWGLTFREVSDEDTPGTETPSEEILIGLRRLHSVCVNPEGWIIGRLERVIDGKLSGAWRAEHVASCKGPDWRRVEERPDLSFIIVRDNGDYDSSKNGPPWALLARDVREAIKSLDRGQTKAVAS